MKLFRPMLCSVRREFVKMNSGGDLVQVSVNKDTGFATVSMCKPPVNSLNLELLSSLRSALNDLEKNKCKGLILTSDNPTVFCAGFDINEIYKPVLDRYMKFWTAFQDVWLKLYLSSFPVVAAINGHSPAGGCVLALGCEYRIMVAPKFKIGLNETRVGVVATPWIMGSMTNAVGTRQAELALINGTIFTAEEAYKIGLVDELVTSKDEALQKAEAFLENQSKLPDMARTLTKNRFRESTVSKLLKNREEDAKVFYNFATQPEVQKGLEVYLSSLKKK